MRRAAVEDAQGAIRRVRPDLHVDRGGGCCWLARGAGAGTQERLLRCRRRISRRRVARGPCRARPRPPAPLTAGGWPLTAGRWPLTADRLPLTDAALRTSGHRV